MRAAVHALLVLAGVVAGLGASLAISAAASPVSPTPVVREARSDPPREARVADRPAAPPQERSLSGQEVAAIVRAEIERDRAGRRSDAAAGEREAVWTPAQEAAAVESYALLSEHADRAAAEGRWTDADRDVAMEHIGRLDPERRAEFQDRLIRAINAGRVAVLSNGAPWW